MKFQFRPKSPRCTGSSPFSDTSSSAVETDASNDAGRVSPRTVRRPVTRTPPSVGRTLSAAKVKSGWLPTSKKSAERRCVSRREFFVSIDSAATVMTPLTSPAAVTVPFPLT